MLKVNKYFYFLKLKLIILNNKYLVFSKNNIKNKNLLIFKTKLLYSLFIETNILLFIKNNYYIICFNENNKFLLLTHLNIYALSYCGFFINNNNLINIKNYYLFYTKNLKIYIYLIYYIIYIYTLIIYIYLFKFLVLLIT